MHNTWVGSFVMQRHWVMVVSGSSLRVFIRTILVACVASILSGCFIPKSLPPTDEERECKLVTKRMILKVSDNAFVPVGGKCSGDQCLAELAIIAAIPVGSALVSGSIVVVGNTAHWLEYQGRCEQGFLQRTAKAFVETYNKFKQPLTTPATR